MQQWADLRREHFVAGKSIKELARSTGLSRTRSAGAAMAFSSVSVLLNALRLRDFRSIHA